MARRKPSVRSIAFTAVLLAWAVAFFIAAPWLAAWFYGVDTATGDQIKSVKAMLAAPIAVPLLLAFLWSKWDDRRRHRAGVRQALYAAKLTDPAHERRLDKGARAESGKPSPRT